MSEDVLEGEGTFARGSECKHERAGHDMESGRKEVAGMGWRGVSRGSECGDKKAIIL